MLQSVRRSRHTDGCANEDEDGADNFPARSRSKCLHGHRDQWRGHGAIDRHWQQHQRQRQQSDFFTLAFNGNAGETLNQLVVDLTNTPLVFDENLTNGFPFTIGSNPGGISASHTLSPDNRILTINFGNTFQPGQTISFGIDRDLAPSRPPGTPPIISLGADIVATIDSSTTLRGAFANQLGADSLSPMVLD